MSKKLVERLDIALVLLAFLLCAPFLFAPKKGTAPTPWEKEQILVQQRFKSAMQIDRKKLELHLQENPALLRRFQITSLGMLLLGAGVGLAWLRLFLKALFRKPIVASLGSPSAPTWGLRQILRVALAAFVMSQLAFLVAWGMKSLLPVIWLDRHTLSLGSTLLIDLVVIVGVLRFVHLSRGPMGRSLGFALTSYLTFLPMLVCLLLLTAWVLQFLGIEPRPQTVFTIYLAEERAAVVGWLLLLATLVGPIAEELFFRGMLYGWLRTRIGVARGLLLSSFLFSLLHADYVAFLPILGLGVLFGFVYERTGTLLAPMAIHMAHNGGMLSMASLIKSMADLP